MSLFIPITKVDIAQRLVYGTISEEVPDKTGEILDYASAKPAFEAWSRQFHSASGGKSLGNVRAMHGAIAAGKLTDISFDDENKRIDGVAKIIDDDEWDKVLEGVYTGFSIGGGYARRWPDAQNPNLMRYTPVLSEVSLVDNPALHTATFQVVKRDGSMELRKFHAAMASSALDKEAENADDLMQPKTQLLSGLDWLAAHAHAIGAAGLLAHINAIESYLQEFDEGDEMNVSSVTKFVNVKDLPLREDTIEALQKRIAQLEAQPMPAKGNLRVVGKQEDRLAFTSADPQLSVNPHMLMKAALANPQVM